MAHHVSFSSIAGVKSREPDSILQKEVVWGYAILPFLAQEFN